MRAVFNLLVTLFLCVHAGAAQELSALARVDAARSQIADGWFGATRVTVGLSKGVPFRVFQLDAPARLVVDFREADWSGVTPEALIGETERVSGVRFGAFRPGWSRLVVDLAVPMLPKEIAMPVDAASGQAQLQVALEEVSPETFAAAAGAPADPGWASGLTAPPEPQRGDPERFTVVLDPGHGGIDPGAEAGGVSEKVLMLSFARELRDVLRRSDVDVVMTRDEDVFVALERRVAIAHQVEANVFISLHADNLLQGGAKGATVYTLSDEASDAATAHLAARHNRSDIIAGADLTGSDDQITSVLLDLVRLETEPRSKALAETLVAEMDAAGGPMNRRPLRHAGFSVLKSADIPSVLVEVGFLSSPRDLANLRDPVWRSVMVQAMADGVLRWRDQDAAWRPLVRQ